MAPDSSFGRVPGPVAGRPEATPIDDQRLDPKLERRPSGAAPAALPAFLFIGLPICFAFALGIILIGFRGSVTIESMVFLVLGSLGLLLVRYLNRHL
jgi:hypothetical protein